LEGHDKGWDEAKEYYRKIFERELREANQQWKEEGANNEYSEEMAEEYEESEVDDEWSSYGQKETQNRRSLGNGSISPMMRVRMPSSMTNCPIRIERVLFYCRL
jgi:uncharacterized protein with von Willebrand factor type A (vWA) domain